MTFMEVKVGVRFVIAICKLVVDDKVNQLIFLLFFRKFGYNVFPRMFCQYA